MVVPFRLFDRYLSLGMAYQQQIDYVYKYERTMFMTDWAPYRKGDSRTSVNTISFCASYRIIPAFSLGITFNKWFSTGHYYERVYVNNPDWSYYSNRTHDGFNLNAGLMVYFEELINVLPLKFGVRIMTPFELERTYDYSGRYSGENLIRSYEVPTIIGMGLSYRLGEYFTLAMDYNIRPFKDKMIRNYGDIIDEVDIETFSYSDYHYSASNANLNQFRMGLEYLLDLKKVCIPFRIGYKTNPTNESNYDIDKNPSQVFAKSFNAGTGITLKYSSVDLAYERYWYRYKSDYDEYDSKKEKNNIIGSIIIYLR